ncbi:hypothetical protein BC828DRAFT_18168 [Blastocladiella britannica]|nr:hypothetical protein BC828DRAFT_18168 [Blastocladiella britannica]
MEMQHHHQSSAAAIHARVATGPAMAANGTASSYASVPPPPPPLLPTQSSQPVVSAAYFLMALRSAADEYRARLARHPRTTISMTLAAIATFAFVLVTALSPSGPPPLPTHVHRVILPPARSFGFAEREPGNFSPLTNGLSPRSPALARKPGLLAVPVGKKSVAGMASVLQTFDAHGFDVMLFHYDDGDAEWLAALPQFVARKWISVSARRQSKFWFAKRFLTPTVVDNYDYIFLWDDDVGFPAKDWSPLAFVELLKKYHIHIAQPALVSGTIDNYQHDVVAVQNKTGHPGRFTNFVEVMFPVFSRAAWPCAWRMLPFDGVSFWGADNAWYPVCASANYCRFAVIDAMPVHHLDKKTLGQNVGVNLRELDHYNRMVRQPCDVLDRENQTTSAAGAAVVPIADRPKLWRPTERLDAATTDVHARAGNMTAAVVRGTPWSPTNAVRAACAYMTAYPPVNKRAFYSVRNITDADATNPKTCPEGRQHWPEAVNNPWWWRDPTAAVDPTALVPNPHPIVDPWATSPPAAAAGYFLHREDEAAELRKMQEREKRRKRKKGGSWL